jgi:hypothetical protein
VVSFSDKVEIWMKDGSEEEPMIGLASPLYCLYDEELEGNRGR